MIAISIRKIDVWTPIVYSDVWIQYPEAEIKSSLKTGLNSKPENLMFGIILSGIKFMSIGLIVV